MNPRSDQPAKPSQSDAALLFQLSQGEKEIEPEPGFAVQLETDLRQTRQPTLGNAYQRNSSLRRLSRRLTLTLYASLAIAATLTVTTLASRWLPEQVASALTSTVDPQANAQTLVQPVQAGQIVVRADAHEFNEETQESRAIGNAAFIYVDA